GGSFAPLPVAGRTYVIEALDVKRLGANSRGILVPMGNEGMEMPIGRVLWDTVQALHREFDAQLARAGGSRPVWFILLALCSGPVASQRELAERVGIQDATLTHHLATLEAAGVIRRFRSPE